MHARWFAPASVVALMAAAFVAVDVLRAPAAFAQDIRRERRGGAPPGQERDPRARPPGERPGDGDPRVRPPGERPDTERWVLGAVVESLETGVRVRDVARRSAAERAGLERDDVIITVNGLQVGRVAGREFPLDEELQLQADSSGRVRLLVHNRRNGRLVNLDVQLDRDRPGPPPGPREGIVTGEFTYRDSTNLPRDAELRLRIIRRKLIGADVIAERTDKLHGRLPTSFEIRYPQHPGDRDRDYELEADIFADGRRLFSDDGRNRFPAHEPPSRLVVVMRRR